MNQGLGLWVLLASFVGTMSAMAEPRVVGSATALRAGPDRLYEVERTLGSGTRVELIEVSGGWALVQLRNGLAGWVLAGRLVQPRATRVAVPAYETPEEGDYSSVVWPRAGRLNLLEGPGMAHSVVRMMDKGDWVKVVERSGNWLKLQHISGDEGWAHKAYLTR